MKVIPFDFVLENLMFRNPTTRAMFGCTAVYVGPKIMVILRQKKDHLSDNGVWIATTAEHHASLKEDFPSMRSIEIFGPGPTGWQNIPETSEDFEEAVLKLCEFIVKNDPRIGKIPKSRSVGKSKKKKLMKERTPTKKKMSLKKKSNKRK